MRSCDVDAILRAEGSAPHGSPAMTARLRARLVARGLFVAWAAATVFIAVPFGNH